MRSVLNIHDVEMLWNKRRILRVISSNVTSQTDKLYQCPQLFKLLKIFVQIEGKNFTVLFLNNLKCGMEEIAYRLARSCKIQQRIEKINLESFLLVYPFTMTDYLRSITLFKEVWIHEIFQAVKLPVAGF